MIRNECLNGKNVGDQAAHLPAVGHEPGGPGLQHHVSYSRGFGRSCYDGDADGVRRPLVEEVVGAASADDVELSIGNGAKSRSIASTSL